MSPLGRALPFFRAFLEVLQSFHVLGTYNASINFLTVVPFRKCYRLLFHHQNKSSVPHFKRLVDKYKRNQAIVVTQFSSSAMSALKKKNLFGGEKTCLKRGNEDKGEVEHRGNEIGGGNERKIFLPKKKGLKVEKKHIW